MRLLSLTVRNFRGFGSAGAPIALDADLILMFGPSGFGKTSLAEAIEWLFYGTTRRRLRGDSYSKNEYDWIVSKRSRRHARRSVGDRPPYQRDRARTDAPHS